MSNNTMPTPSNKEINGQMQYIAKILLLRHTQHYTNNKHLMSCCGH